VNVGVAALPAPHTKLKDPASSAGICVWREADVESADLETVIIDLLDGQYRDPRRVVAFNTAETRSQDGLWGRGRRVASALRPADHGRYRWSPSFR